MKTQKCFLLSGLPGSGKSTWCKNYLKKHSKTLVISMDSLREMLHADTYIFDKDLEPTIRFMTDSLIQHAIETNRNIIIDETNGTRCRREKLINIISDCDDRIKIICVVFKEGNNLKNRMKQPRGYTRQKWLEIICKMKHYWQPVTKTEGFDQIIKI